MNTCTHCQHVKHWRSIAARVENQDSTVTVICRSCQQKGPPAAAPPPAPKVRAPCVECAMKDREIEKLRKDYLHLLEGCGIVDGWESYDSSE